MAALSLPYIMTHYLLQNNFNNKEQYHCWQTRLSPAGAESDRQVKFIGTFWMNVTMLMM